jgi:hypothetical protein
MRSCPKRPSGERSRRIDAGRSPLAALGVSNMLLLSDISPAAARREPTAIGPHGELR